MPARVHAILVARSSANALTRVQRTLDALSAQTLPPAAVTIVMRGSTAPLRGSAGVTLAAEAVIETRANATIASAVTLALPRVQEGASTWILTDEAVPEPEALEHLVGALERSPSATVAAPKLVDLDDPRRIVSFGQSMTRYGRAIDPARGELDQAQHDAQDDALGADVRGVLVRAGNRELRPDPGLGGADEGLDLGVRARLAGGRVVLTAAARVAIEVDPDAETTAGHAFAARRAQLHRRLSYAPAFAVPLHWLSLLPLALWRSVTHLVGKRPAAVAPEWGAAAVALVNGGSVAQTRRSIRTHRSASWASIAPLRVTRAQLRQRLDDGHGAEGGAVQELGFFSGGGAWAVLAALVVGIVAFTGLLAWPALGGGALLPLRQTVAALWRDAAYGLRGIGVDLVGPADPFSGVVAVIGSLWPAAPSFAMVLLWVAALPLATLGGWFAATRITDRPGLRIFGAAVWALAPTFVIALAQGRPAAVIAHLLLPWLFFAAVVAHRSWGAAGAASILVAATLACAPSLAPALVLLWFVAMVTLLARGWLRGAVRLLWTLIPAVVVFLPLIVWQIGHGNPWALLADPGAVVGLPQAGADPAGRLALVAGSPTTGDAGWAAMLGGSAAWVPWLSAPLAVLALLAPLSRRWSAGLLSIVVAAAGMATALAVVGVVVSFDQSVPVAIWPGTALSLAWIGVTGAALVTLDSLVTLPVLRRLASIVAAVAVAVVAVPSLTALPRDASMLTNGPLSTLPAYVNAQARDDRDLGTLVLTAQQNGGLGTQVVWGASATLGAQATIVSTALTPRDAGIAELSVDLISARDFDAPGALSQRGIRYVLLEAASRDESEAAKDRRRSAVTALDQRPGFVRVGETTKGVLWRLEAEPAPRAELSLAQQSTARLFTVLELVVLFAALLLAIPTRASRRAARGLPRAVGLVAEREPRQPQKERKRADAERAEKPVKEKRAKRARAATDPSALLKSGTASAASAASTPAPQEAPDAEAADGAPTPDDVTPGNTVPEDVTPQNEAPYDVTPEDVTSRNEAPAAEAPEATAPEATAGDATAAETAPQGAMEAERRADSAPAETAETRAEPDETSPVAEATVETAADVTVTPGAAPAKDASAQEDRGQDVAAPESSAPETREDGIASEDNSTTGDRQGDGIASEDGTTGADAPDDATSGGTAAKEGER